MLTMSMRMHPIRAQGPQVGRPVSRLAPALSSKTNGIAACRGLSISAVKRSAVKPNLQQQQQSSGAAGLEILCADGRRGGKLKTRKAAAKRYRVTGSGRVVVRHAGKNHFQEKKSSSRKRKLSGTHLASETHLNLIRGCLPYAKVGK